MGLFWEDGAKNVKPQSRPIPSIPETGWRAKAHYPSLAKAKLISIDTETWDPELNDAGPGWARGKGHIVGVSVATDDGFKGYYPIRHTVCPEQNLPAETVFAWLREELGRPTQTKAGANLLYDIGWLRQEGVLVKGPKLDAQFAEALLDEDARVALEALGQKYLREGKESSVMYEWLADAYGGKPNGSQRANIYRCPPSLVGYYAESDAELPIRILKKQWPLIVAAGLERVFSIECRLIDLLIEMRFQGVSVSMEKAEQARSKLILLENDLQSSLNNEAGFMVSVNSSKDLAKLFDQRGWEYPRTPVNQATGKGGGPSFTADFLESIADSNNIAKVIHDLRKNQKARSTFIEKYILQKSVNGKLYGVLHPLKGDSNGTVSGRFAASDPNLQNIPARDEILGPLIRGCFVPDYGHERWRAMDYSSIEYRFLAHFAVGSGADAVRQVFAEDPFADYHDIVCNMINDATGVGIKRKQTKTINFGLVYGMGIPKLAAALGLSEAKGRELVDIYFGAAPYVKSTLEHYANVGARTGEARTILGRASRFNMWVPRGARGKVPLPYEEAVAVYGPKVERVGLHKVVNRVLQGSSADLIKKAMVDCWESGVFDETGVPRVQVHDELDWSDPGNVRPEAWREARHIMETCIEGLKVPIRVATDLGPTWGEAEEVEYDSI